jgi:glycosyltransferase involved in cell wall biosynthesis
MKTRVGDPQSSLGTHRSIKIAAHPGACRSTSAAGHRVGAACRTGLGNLSQCGQRSPVPRRGRDDVPGSECVSQLSIVIATYNRGEMLQSCLQALERQTQPPDDFEVVVVIDGSTDETAERLSRLSTSYRVRFLEEPHQGQCAALNRGIDAAQGPYCLILDDDIIAGPELVAEHLALQRARGQTVGIGQLTITIPSDADEFTRCLATWWRGHYDLLNRGVRAPTYQDAYSGNLSAPRDALLAAGGFAEDLRRSFDVELAYRLEQHGLSFAYLSGAVGDQDFRKGFHAVARDSERAGAASLELLRRHPAMLTDLPLAAFSQCSLRILLLRRMLLSLRPPNRVLERVGTFIPAWAWKQAWYRFLHDYYYWCGVRSAADPDLWQRVTRGPIVLMYHAFGEEWEPASRYVLPRRAFARQLGWLKYRGYHVMGTDDLLAFRRRHRLPPARSVIITIDDGYADTARVAAPLLRRLRLPATVFLVSGAMESRNAWAYGTELHERPLLTWLEVDELLRDGVRIGAHSRTHPSLIAVTADHQNDEIRGSREDLEHRLDRQVPVFAYPYGDFNEHTIAAVERAGFEAAFGCQAGANDPAVPPSALRRNEVRGSDSLLSFALMLWLGKSDPLARLWRGDA